MFATENERRRFGGDVPTTLERGERCAAVVEERGG